MVIIDSREKKKGRRRRRSESERFPRSSLSWLVSVNMGLRRGRMFDSHRLYFSFSFLGMAILHCLAQNDNADVVEALFKVFLIF